MNSNKNFSKVFEKAQIDEELGSIIYKFMANREKNETNKSILEKMSNDEKRHSIFWMAHTKKELKPNIFMVLFLKFLTITLGFTFVVKVMQKAEQVSADTYEKLKKELPDVAQILEDERRHENELYSMLDEEKLHYVGAIVLGLNDALVELTGAIAGVTFALANTKLVAMTGIITGVSATLSMAASNYLAERANGNNNALKSSIYTGIAYLVTVVFLVLPYLLLPDNLYILAFGIMITIVLLIIFFFNYYISVAKEEKFFKNFITMALISISVALISFVIGTLAKNFIGIDV
ncbi:VIT family protein [compost metagenome]